MPDKIVIVNSFGEQSENVLIDDMGVNGKKITNLADPTTDQDAANKKYVDDNAGGGVSETTLDHDLDFGDDSHVVTPTSTTLKLVKVGKIVNAYFTGLSINLTVATQVFADAASNLPSGWIPLIDPADGGCMIPLVLPDGSLGFAYFTDDGNFSFGKTTGNLPIGAIYIGAQSLTWRIA